MLKQVALEIAEKLLAIARAGEQEEVAALAHELRGAAKACADPQPPPLRDVLFGPARKSPEEVMRDLEVKREAARAESAGSQAFAEGGPADGLVVPLLREMPAGARTRLEGGVYELTPDRKLKFVES
jgi:hypothetical protein